jgi:hypothetical protein
MCELGTLDGFGDPILERDDAERVMHAAFDP